MLDISCDSSARQTCHLKCKALFPLQNNNKQHNVAATV